MSYCQLMWAVLSVCYFFWGTLYVLGFQVVFWDNLQRGLQTYSFEIHCSIGYWVFKLYHLICIGTSFIFCVNSWTVYLSNNANPSFIQWWKYKYDRRFCWSVLKCVIALSFLVFHRFCMTCTLNYAFFGFQILTEDIQC